MEYTKAGNTLVLRLEKGEEILACLAKLCEAEDVRLASLTGIGAVNRVTLGLFSPGEKEYHQREYAEDFEIVSLAGNITRMDGKPYLHCHAAVANRQGATFGGHLGRAVVSATAELFVTVLPGEVGRRFSNEVGLNLLAFE